MEGPTEDRENTNPNKERLSSEERLYAGKSLFVSRNEVAAIEKERDQIRGQLDVEKAKGIFSKDKKLIASLENSLTDLEKKAYAQQTFVRSQETFLSKRPQTILEGRPMEEVARLLFSHPQLVHFVQDTYKGQRISKMTIAGGGISPRAIGLSDYPLFGSNKKSKELFAGREGGAIPATFTFGDKRGLGIIAPEKDDFKRSGGYVSFWILVPEHEKNVQAYLLQHPEILLMIFKKEFKEHDRSGGQLPLISTGFIDAN